MINNNIIENSYDDLLFKVKELILDSKHNVSKAINYEMINLYWNIGKEIIEKQGGKERAKYGDMLIDKLSKELINLYGKGFSIQNIRRMRQFYLCFENRSTLSSELSWSHYLELIKIKDEKIRNYYMKECINSNWSVRELQRQKTTFYYERTLTNKNKIYNNQTEKFDSIDIIKDPFVLEFLDIKDNNTYLENDLERNILNHLKEFLLELGKGFTFVGNQMRITLDNEHYYPDLVFYNRILKCFVIIDLKIGKVSHKDIGQMQMYVNYYDRIVKDSFEEKTIGILLSSDKNETVVKYTLPEDNKTIFSSEYRLTIPSEKELIGLIENEKQRLELLSYKEQ